MRRFRFLFVVFALALLAPLAFLVERALHSVALEQQLRHQAVAERVFDEMERALSRLLAGEEERPFDAYGAAGQLPAYPFILGYFQVDPDGGIHALSAPGLEDARAEVERTVGAYWRARRGAASARQAAALQSPGTTIHLGQGDQPGPAGSQPRPAGAPPAQGDAAAARNEVSAFDALRSLNKGVEERTERQRKAVYGLVGAGPLPSARPAPGAQLGGALAEKGTDAERRSPPASRDERLDAASAEIDLPPMSGRVVDGRHLMLYRTVVRDTQGYRQGLLLDVEQLGAWLREQGVGGDGLARYATVSFATPLTTASGPVGDSAFVYQHRFAEPFDDLSARLALRPLPGVGSVTYVYALSALLLATGVLGLAALYRMVSVIVSFAERRSNFVAAVSHELKTPLTAIRMYGEMLRDGMVASDAKRGEYYRHITVESERLSRLINNVLEFSHLEKGNRHVALVVGAVAPVVREVAELLRPHVEGQGFALQLEIEADLPAVRFERDALVQVLCNLVDNAVKYAGDASPKRIVLHCVRDGSGVRVTVRDHGPGVPSRHLGRIFEPFYRAESELTRRSKGTGLGLALVRGLVERMGARVTGRNPPDGGFAVEIVFRAGAV